MPKTELNAPMNAIDRLGLRVSAMIQAPNAQLNRRVKIFQLDTDPDYAWQAILELLRETDGLEMTFNDDGGVTLKWGLPTEGDQRIEEEGELEPVEAARPF